MQKEKSDIYQIKVTLGGISPPIWRRLLVSGDITLDRLHQILQVALGWYNCHLHSFSAGQKRYEPRDEVDGLDIGPEAVDEASVTLRKVAPKEGDAILYEYDFGDGWEHQVVVEKILPAEPDAKYPVCIGGERACPPEDCGGIFRYQYIVQEILPNPKHPEREEWLEWAGEEFDPAKFDPDEVNERMKSLR